MQLNPIVKKDIRVTSRSVKLSLGLLIYEAVLALILYITLQIIKVESISYYYPDNIYQNLVYIFPVLSIAQIGIVALITPILTSSSISGERERQTFDIMLTTCLPPISIIMGKVSTAVVRVLLYVVASIPIMALSFVIGGTSWWTLLAYFIAVTILSIWAGSIGIYCSSLCNKSISAVILSFIIYGIFCGGTFIPMLFDALSFRGSIKESPLFLLLNPIMFFEEFYMLTLGNESLFGATNGASSVLGNQCGVIVGFLSQGYTWLILSGIVLLLTSLLFIFASARQINPIYSSRKRKPKKSAQKDKE